MLSIRSLERDRRSRCRREQRRVCAYRRGVAAHRAGAATVLAGAILSGRIAAQMAIIGPRSSLHPPVAGVRVGMTGLGLQLR